MNDKKDFEAALKGKKVPLLVLDQKWHRLFAIHGKTDEISATEKELDELLKLQGKYNNELKNLKKLKSKIMSNIVANMGDCLLYTSIKFIYTLGYDRHNKVLH